MAKDKDYIKLIHTKRWLRLRRDVLTANPLCEQCTRDGYLTPATEVHHRRPVEYGTNLSEKRRLMYDPDNLMAVCHGCHVKIHIEMGRAGREATRRRNDAQVSDIVKKFFGGGEVRADDG